MTATRAGRVAIVLATIAVATLTATPSGAARATSPARAAATDPGASVSTARPGRVPVLAYYYIWFDPSSWERGKADIPELGKYSSDDANVMRQHIEWAKAAGIDGFIVSWKDTPTLTRRLSQLVDIADQENFKLAIIYEGLDNDRNPLPGGAATIARDLDTFMARFASRAPFQIFEKPLVIWSGTWEYSPQDVASVTASRRDRLLILASERNVKGYQRLGSSVDGDAYYWSSVNPSTYPNYLQKLVQLGQAATANGGLWIAPAAPGFDARKIGKTTVVPRKDGRTLDDEMSAALSSGPDAVGLISWNEFSEGSYVEPSRNYGVRYLNYLGARLGSGAPIADVDPRATSPASDPVPEPGASATSDTADSSSSNASGFPTGLVVFPLFVLAFVVLLFVAARRGRGRDRGQPGDGPDTDGGGGGRRPGGTLPPAPPGSRRARREARKRRFRPGPRPRVPVPPSPPAPSPREPQPTHASVTAVADPATMVAGETSPVPEPTGSR